MCANVLIFKKMSKIRKKSFKTSGSFTNVRNVDKCPKNKKCPQMSINLHKFVRSRKMSKFPQVLIKCPLMSKNVHKSPKMTMDVLKYSKMSSYVHNVPLYRNF